MSTENFECSLNKAVYNLSFKRDHFPDEKYERKFVKAVKSMVRNSIEYSEWTEYLIFEKHLTKCLFTGEELAECIIQFHHHPISLQNIIEAVVDRYMQDRIMFSSADVFLEIMKLHFGMKIGVVPLVTTLNQKFHNGFLKIPIEYVIGDYNWFLENYTLRDKAQEVVRRYLTVQESNHIGWGKNDYLVGDDK